MQAILWRQNPQKSIVLAGSLLQWGGMFSLFKVRDRRRLEARLDKVTAERDTARSQRDKHKAASQALRDEVARLRSEADQLRNLPVPLQFPPDLTVPPGTAWPPAEPPWFFADNLAIWAKHPVFMKDARFVKAYQRGMQSGHHMARPKGSDADIHIEWRAHVVLWAAQRGARLEGDFVECGVNTGIYSITICDYLDFNQLDKKFWLFDTYDGIPESQMSTEEKSAGRLAMNASYYTDCFQQVTANFAPWPNARLVRGMVPDSLSQVEIGKVSFLSLDMNIALPEIAAIEHFWPKLTPGAIVVLDDYGWGGHEAQCEAMNAFAQRVGVPLLSLPTGQGILIKP